MRLDGKVALVTGASQGMGRAIATRLASDGAAVAINYVGDTARAEDAVRRVRDAGVAGFAVAGDVADRAAVNAFVDKIIARMGRIDILVNNAGIFPWKRWTDITVEEWDRVMAVNVRGAFNCAQAVYPHMAALQSGRIVNVSSTVFFSGPQFLLHYVTSKAALVGLTRGLAREVADANITVNAVATGRTVTEGVQAWIDEGVMSLEDAVNSRQTQCIKRLGTPDDLANVVSFLVSEDAGYMTGQLVNVDGGRHMH